MARAQRDVVKALARQPVGSVLPGPIFTPLSGSGSAPISTFARQVSSEQMQRCYELYSNDPVLMRCKTLFSFWLFSRGNMQITWGPGEEPMAETFVNAVQENAVEMFDYLLMFGVIPWFPDTEKTMTGKKYIVPAVVPYGTFGIERGWKKSKKFKMEWRCVPSCAGSDLGGVRASAYDATQVYVYKPWAPAQNGALRSPLRSLLTTANAVADLVKDRKVAGRLSAFPPLVTQHRAQTGGTTADASRRTVYDLGDARAHREQVAQEERASAEARLEESLEAAEASSARGSRKQDGNTGPDPITGDETNIPEFAMHYRSNKIPLPAGQEIARPNVPTLPTDTLDWSNYRDDIGATVLGLPVALVVPRASRDAAQVDAYREILKVTLAFYADLMERVLEKILNSMYALRDTEEIIDRLYFEEDMPPTKRKKLAEALQQEIRYKVKIPVDGLLPSVDIIIKMAERGIWSRETEAELLSKSAGTALEKIEIQAPKNMLTPSIAITTQTAMEKERTKQALSTAEGMSTIPPQAKPAEVGGKRKQN
jgi:hypothetical protein